MKKSILILATTIFHLFVFGQTNTFSEQPWKNEKYPIIIDPYQDNSIDFDKLLTDRRTVAIIHKASQGLKADNKFVSRGLISKSKNLLYASYHLGTNTDPIKQADFYLSIIKDHLNEPTALDIENIGGNNISLKDAEKFINRIFEKTNHFPFVYVNNKVFEEINLKYDKNSVFAKCPLWYARFLLTLPKLSNKVWDKVTVWQFSCELNCKETGKCLYNVPGTRFDIDVNAFNGSLDELKLFWKGFEN